MKACLHREIWEALGELPDKKQQRIRNQRESPEAFSCALFSNQIRQHLEGRCQLFPTYDYLYSFSYGPKVFFLPFNTSIPLMNSNTLKGR